MPLFLRNAKSPMLIAVIACAMALLGWIAYEQTREASAPARNAVPAVQALPSGAREGAATSLPPMPYRFAGTSLTGDATQFLLEKDSRVFPVTAGMILDRDYRVDTVSEREIALVHLPTGSRQAVSMHLAPWPPQTAAPGAASAAPARASALPPAVQRTTSPALIELAR